MAKKETKKVTKAKTKNGTKVGGISVLLEGSGRFDNFYMPFKNPIGRPLKYTPEELADLFGEYVEWCRTHPLNETKESLTTGGEEGFSETRLKYDHPRLISIDSFLVYIGADKNWWTHLDDGERGEEFLHLKSHIKNYCESYQKEMASAGFFKQNIISRLLGLTDKKEVTATGEGVTIVVKDKEEKDKLENIGDLGI